MTTSRVAALAVMVMSAPMVAGFAPTGLPIGLQNRACAINRAASSVPTLRTAALGLRMQEDAVAGVNEVSDQEQRSLSKTRTNKRPRTDNKNKRPLSEYIVGEMTKGKIVSIMPYGAFVDVGTTTDGLVHVSQIANEFVSDIESVVKVGDEVECRIVSVDTDNNKISLSMRTEPAKAAGGQRQGGGGRSKAAELPEEFRNYDDQKFIPGKVGLPGCFPPFPPSISIYPSIHSRHYLLRAATPSPFASYMVCTAPTRVGIPPALLSSPSLEQPHTHVHFSPRKVAHEAVHPHSPPSCPSVEQVTSVMDYGCFVTISEGVEALVHVSEMSEERVSKPEAVVKVGDEVQVRNSAAPHRMGLCPGRPRSEVVTITLGVGIMRWRSRIGTSRGG